MAYRAVTKSELDALSKDEVNAGFTSVAIEKENTQEFIDHGEHELVAEVHVPSGSRGAYIGHHSGVSDETEFLLDKGTKFKVSQKGDKYILEVQNG